MLACTIVCNIPLSGGAQHAPVYTLGKRGKGADVLATAEELQRMGAVVHQSPRGGEATFHGPGQARLK